MTEEISLDRNYRLHEASCQPSFLATLFADAEDKLRSAPTRQDAKRITREVIPAFEKACISEVLLAFYKHHLDALIDKYWETGREFTDSRPENYRR